MKTKKINYKNKNYYKKKLTEVKKRKGRGTYTQLYINLRNTYNKNEQK
jgi:hypothetical protein